MSSILIVGGTGSFGHAYLDYLQEVKYPHRIRVFSRDEDKHVRLKLQYPDLELETMIGDVRNEYSYTQAARKMDVVIHAAALKHVPIGELFTEEALQTNTQGVINCVKACQAQNVRKAVFLSTDKAVYPINAYGMTKALGEKILQSKISQDTETTFCITRYGNVLGSRGSILPVIEQRVSANEPLLLTDLSMTRFIMNLQEAVHLVSFAINQGQDGQLFVRKVPACALKTLVDAYLHSHFNTSLENYGYELVGIRPGEKIHEALATEEELTRATLLADEIISVEPYSQQELYRGTRGSLHLEHPHALSSDTVPQLNLEETIQCLKAAGL